MHLHCLLWYGYIVVLREAEFMNDTELTNVSMLSSYNSSEADSQSLKSQEVLCAPPVTNKTWQMASGYIGAVLMLVMAVYGRYAALVSRY